MTIIFVHSLIVFYHLMALTRLMDRVGNGEMQLMMFGLWARMGRKEQNTGERGTQSPLPSLSCQARRGLDSDKYWPMTQPRVGCPAPAPAQNTTTTVQHSSGEIKQEQPHCVTLRLINWSSCPPFVEFFRGAAGKLGRLGKLKLLDAAEIVFVYNSSS